MIANDIFETETMAELCARQGRLGEAIQIFRHLIEVAPASPARGRWATRLSELETRWRPGGDAEVVPAAVPIPAAPGVAVQAADDVVTVAWSLPPGTPAPALEIFYVQKTPAGVETGKRQVALEEPAGRLALAVPGLHSALAAVGRRVEERFVPLARSPRE
jgi:hypothetical protein